MYVFFLKKETDKMNEKTTKQLLKFLKIKTLEQFGIVKKKITILVLLILLKHSQTVQDQESIGMI